MDEVVRVRDEEAARVPTLPKWAQAYIENLRMERDAAIRALNHMVDQDTPSPSYFEEHPCTGEERSTLFSQIVEAAKTVALYEQRETAGETLSAADYTFKRDAQGRLEWLELEFEELVEELEPCRPS